MSEREHPDQPPRHEPEAASYLRVARFATEATAARVYQRAQDAIRRTPCDLSVYRFLLNQVSHVAALGMAPPPTLDAQLRRLFAAGEAAPLPTEVLTALVERRRQATRRGPWTEGHYRPGRRL